jgi:hypothetical protein
MHTPSSLIKAVTLKHPFHGWKSENGFRGDLEKFCDNSELGNFYRNIQIALSNPPKN